MDIDCKIAAVLARVEYKVATLLTTAVSDSGGTAAAVLLQQPLQFTQLVNTQEDQTSQSVQRLCLGWMAGK